jgi:hypothetical protein
VPRHPDQLLGIRSVSEEHDPLFGPQQLTRLACKTMKRETGGSAGRACELGRIGMGVRKPASPAAGFLCEERHVGVQQEHLLAGTIGGPLADAERRLHMELEGGKRGFDPSGDGRGVLRIRAR